MRYSVKRRGVTTETEASQFSTHTLPARRFYTHQAPNSWAHLTATERLPSRHAPLYGAKTKLVLTPLNATELAETRKTGRNNTPHEGAC